MLYYLAIKMDGYWYKNVKTVNYALDNQKNASYNTLIVTQVILLIV